MLCFLHHCYHQKRSFTRSSGGQVLIESVIALLTLTVLFVGATHLIRMLHVRTALRQVAFETARNLSLTTADKESVATTAKQNWQSMLGTDQLLTITTDNPVRLTTSLSCSGAKLTGRQCQHELQTSMPYISW